MAKARLDLRTDSIARAPAGRKIQQQEVWRDAVPPNIFPFGSGCAQPDPKMVLRRFRRSKKEPAIMVYCAHFIDTRYVVACSWEVWRAGYPLGAPPRSFHGGPSALAK